jgi:hypothetical protein
VPYIKSLSDTGLLTIGWDKIMAPPLGYAEIPKEQIAIIDWSAFSQQDVDQRLELGYYTIPG